MLKPWDDISAKLREKFPPEEIEWRIAQVGQNDTGKIWAKVLAYITARAIDDRLDAAAGPENWWVEYRHDGNAVLCGLTIRGMDSDGGIRSVTKWDGADQTDIEAVKGGISSAKKRAGVPWGIGRYLYDLPEGWAVVSPNSKERGKEWRYQPADRKKNVPSFYWRAPDLPDWALPEGVKVPRTRKEAEIPDAGNEPPLTVAEKVAENNSYGIPADAYLILDSAKTYKELYDLCGELRDRARAEGWNQNANRFFVDRKAFLEDIERNGLEAADV